MNGAFRLRRQDDITFLMCEPLALAGFVHAFSTRHHGVSRMPENALNLGFGPCDTRDNVTRNRDRFLHAIGAADMRLVTMRQVHSAEIIAIHDGRDPSAGKPAVGDALITDLAGVLIAVQTADCVPVLIADHRRKVVAAIHAGWRGTIGRIGEATMSRLQKEYGSRSEDCVVALGPAAGACCYEIGPEVVELFHSQFTYADRLITNHKPGGKAHLDLPAAIVRQLIGSGIPQSNVCVSELCTLCRNDLFFSHRLEHTRGVGRMMSVIGVTK